MKTHVSCSITFFRKSYRLWDNFEKYIGNRRATNDVIIWRLSVACWISKAIRTYAPAHAHAPGYPHARKHAHTDQYVILIVFPQQQWFSERASMLRYTYIVIFSVIILPKYFIRCDVHKYACDILNIILDTLVHHSFCIFVVLSTSRQKLPAVARRPVLGTVAFMGSAK